jgi:hypothetical protein
MSRKTHKLYDRLEKLEKSLQHTRYHLKTLDDELFDMKIDRLIDQADKINHRLEKYERDYL